MASLHYKIKQNGEIWENPAAKPLSQHKMEDSLCQGCPRPSNPLPEECHVALGKSQVQHLGFLECVPR